MNLFPAFRAPPGDAPASSATETHARWERLEVCGELFAETGTRDDSVYGGHCVVTLRGENGRFVIGEAPRAVEAELARLLGRRVRAVGRAHWVRQADRTWRRAAFVIESVQEESAWRAAG